MKPENNLEVFKKESLLYYQLDDKIVRCNTCSHNCTIRDGYWGFCETRKNEKGTLNVYNYGLVSSYSINPIEKKPLFHYYPGTTALTIGGFSCNFKCPWCQNWSISKTTPQKIRNPIFLSPNEIKQRILKEGQVKGISVSFNEPTISLEYVLDIFNLLDSDYYKMFVTNGYMTKQALDVLIKSGLTGMSVTVKGDESIVQKYCKADITKVWENITYANSRNIHVEIICLIIPSVNDTFDFYLDTANRLIDIDKNIPLHFTRFFPDYRFTHVSPTPINSLENAHTTAKERGINYVYLGNIPGHPLENTYCHQCHSLLIKRTGYQSAYSMDIEQGRCSTCGEKIPILF